MSVNHRSSRHHPAETIPLADIEKEWKTALGELKISGQQRRIVELVMNGATDKEIADHLGISIFTVQTYLSRLRVRLGVRGRIGLAMHVFRHCLAKHLSGK